jgi:hypothetical protein
MELFAQVEYFIKIDTFDFINTALTIFNLSPDFKYPDKKLIRKMESEWKNLWFYGHCKHVYDTEKCMWDYQHAYLNILEDAVDYFVYTYEKELNIDLSLRIKKKLHDEFITIINAVDWDRIKNDHTEIVRGYVSKVSAKVTDINDLFLEMNEPIDNRDWATVFGALRRKPFPGIVSYSELLDLVGIETTLYLMGAAHEINWLWDEIKIEILNNTKGLLLLEDNTPSPFFETVLTEVEKVINATISQETRALFAELLLKDSGIYYNDEITNPLFNTRSFIIRVLIGTLFASINFTVDKPFPTHSKEIFAQIDKNEPALSMLIQSLVNDLPLENLYNEHKEIFKQLLLAAEA